MTLQDWKLIAQIVQSAAVTIAVLVGGGWALYQFVALRLVAKARADLAAAERVLRQRPPLNVTMKNRVMPDPQTPQRCVVSSICLHNAGTHDETLLL